MYVIHWNGDGEKLQLLLRVDSDLVIFIEYIVHIGIEILN